MYQCINNQMVNGYEHDKNATSHSMFMYGYLCLRAYVWLPMFTCVCMATLTYVYVWLP